MAQKFNLTAELNLRGPSNIKNVVSQIRRELGTVSTNVNLKIDTKASATIDAITKKLSSMNSVLTTSVLNTNSLNSSLTRLGGSLGTFSSSGTKVATSIKDISQSSSAASKNIKGAATSAEEFGKQSLLAAKRFAAFTFATGGIVAFTSAITKGLKAYIEFDKQIIRLRQVTGTGVVGIQALSNEITFLATTLGVGSESLAQISVTLAQAGLTASETKVALKALAKSDLAPSFDSLQETTEGAIAALRQFNLETSDLEAALGSINAVSAAFAVEASDIIAAIQRTGGVFASASKGVSSGTDALNEFLAVFTSVRATTRESAETIATGLRTIFTRIQRAKTIDQLREFGIELQDLEGKFVGPFEAVKRLSEVLNTLDPRDIRFSTIVEELGGFRQIGKVIPLLQQFKTAQEALAVAQTGQGSLTDAQIVAQESLANQLSRVREQFLALIRDIGKSNAFKGLFTIVTGLASGLISLASAFKPIIPILAIIGAVKGVKALSEFGGGFFKALTGSGAKATGENISSSISGSKEKERTEATARAADAIRENTNAISNLTLAVQSLESSIRNRPTGSSLRGGGKVYGFNKGGVVPGSGRGDKVPALLEPGEVVMNNSAVNKYGRGNLVRMNKYAGGNRVRETNQYEVGDVLAKAAGNISSKIQNKKNPKSTLEKNDEVYGFIREMDLLSPLDPNTEINRIYLRQPFSNSNFKKLYKKSEIRKDLGAFRKRKSAQSNAESLASKMGLSIQDVEKFSAEAAVSEREWGSEYEGVIRDRFNLAQASKNPTFPIDTIQRTSSGRNRLGEIKFKSDKENDITLIDKLLRYRLLNNQQNRYFVENDPDPKNRDLDTNIGTLDYYFAGDQNHKQQFYSQMMSGGQIQKFMAGSPRGISVASGKGRGVEGPKGARSYIEPITSETYLKWAKGIYDEYDADPSLVMAAGPGGLRRPPEIALADMLLAQYALETGGAGLSVGQKFVRTPSANITDELRPYLVPDPSDPNELGFFKDDVVKFGKLKKIPQQVSSEISQRKTTSKMQRELFGFALEGVAKSVRDKTLTKKQLEALSPDILEALSKDPQSQVFSLPKLKPEVASGSSTLLDTLKGPLSEFRKSGGQTSLSGVIPEAAAKQIEAALPGYIDSVSDDSQKLSKAKTTQKYFRSFIGGATAEKPGHATAFAETINQMLKGGAIQGFADGGMVQRFMEGGVTKAGSTDVPELLTDSEIERRLALLGGGTGIKGIVSTSRLNELVREKIKGQSYAGMILKGQTLQAGLKSDQGNEYRDFISSAIKEAETISGEDATNKQNLNNQAQKNYAGVFGGAGMYQSGSFDTGKINLIPDPTKKRAIDNLKGPTSIELIPAVLAQDEVMKQARLQAAKAKKSDINTQIGISTSETSASIAKQFGKEAQLEKISQFNKQSSIAYVSAVADALDTKSNGSRIFLDFDKTLAYGADEIGKVAGSDKIDLSAFSDITKVKAGLGNAELSSLSKKLIQLSSEMDSKQSGLGSELLNRMFVVSARPSGTMPLISGWLNGKGLDIPSRNFVGVGGAGLSEADIAIEKAREIISRGGLGQGSVFIDDDPTNIKQSSEQGIISKQYGATMTPEFAREATQTEGLNYQDLVRQTLASYNGTLANAITINKQGQSLDFPNGLGPLASTWFDEPRLATTPTDVKRTITQSKVIENIANYLRLAKGYAFGGRADGPSFEDVRQQIIDKYPEIDFGIRKRKKSSGFGYNLTGALKATGGLSGKDSVNFQQPTNLKQLQEYSDKLASKLMNPEEFAVGGLAEATGSMQSLMSGLYGDRQQQQEVKKQEKNFGQIALRAGNRIQATYIKDGEAGEARSGQVIADKVGSSIYAVQSSAATKGYGPKLYDVVMEAATAAGGMLTSDRKSVSADAKKVWDFYFNNRADVTKTPLDPENWVSNSRLLDEKLYGPPDTWPPATDPAWILQSGYSKAPSDINNPDLVVNRFSGGLIKRFASGGTVPAMVSNGEAFVPPNVAKKIGYSKLDKMNQADRNGMKGFANGGISTFKGAGNGTSDSIGPVGLPTGSYVIREKATKALGLNRGGSVGIRKFASGGRSDIENRLNITRNLDYDSIASLVDGAKEAKMSLAAFSEKLKESKDIAVKAAIDQGKSLEEAAEAGKQAAAKFAGIKLSDPNIITEAQTKEIDKGSITRDQAIDENKTVREQEESNLIQIVGSASTVQKNIDENKQIGAASVDSKDIVLMARQIAKEVGAKVYASGVRGGEDDPMDFAKSVMKQASQSVTGETLRGISSSENLTAKDLNNSLKTLSQRRSELRDKSDSGSASLVETTELKMLDQLAPQIEAKLQQVLQSSIESIDLKKEEDNKKAKDSVSVSPIENINEYVSLQSQVKDKEQVSEEKVSELKKRQAVSSSPIESAILESQIKSTENELKTFKDSVKTASDIYKGSVEALESSLKTAKDNENEATKMRDDAYQSLIEAVKEAESNWDSLSIEEQTAKIDSSMKGSTGIENIDKRAADVKEGGALVKEAKEDREMLERLASSKYGGETSSIGLDSKIAETSKVPESPESIKARTEQQQFADDSFFDYRARKEGTTTRGLKLGIAKDIGKAQFETRDLFSGRKEELGFELAGKQDNIRNIGQTRAQAQSVLETDPENQTASLELANAKQRLSAETEAIVQQMVDLNPTLGDTDEKMKSLRQSAGDITESLASGELQKAQEQLATAIGEAPDSAEALKIAMTRTAKKLGISVDLLEREFGEAGNSAKEVGRQSFIQSREGQRFGALAEFAPDVLQKFSESKTGGRLAAGADFISGKGGRASQAFAKVGGISGAGMGVTLVADQLQKALQTYAPETSKNVEVAGAVGALRGAGTGAASGALLGGQIAGPVGALVAGVGGAIIGGIQGYFSAKNQQILTNALEKVVSTTGELNIAMKKLNQSSVDFAANLSAAKGAFGANINAGQDIRQLGLANTQFGTEDVVSTGAMAVGGAAAGAIAGSFIPIIGTAIGAAIGGLAGATYGFMNRPSEAQRSEALGASIQQSGKNQETASQLANLELGSMDLESLSSLYDQLKEGTETINPIVKQYADGMIQAARNTEIQNKRSGELSEQRIAEITATAETNAALDAYMKSRKESGATDAQIEKELRANKEQAIEVGKEVLSEGAKLMAQQIMLAKSARVLSDEFANLNSIFNKIGQLINRFTSETSQLDSEIQGRIGDLTGKSQVQKTDRKFQRVLGNVGAYSEEQVREASDFAVNIAGGGSEAKAFGQIALIARTFQTQLPKLVADSNKLNEEEAKGEEGNDIIAELRSQLEKAASVAGPIDSGAQAAIDQVVGQAQGDLQSGKSIDSSDSLSKYSSVLESGSKTLEQFTSTYYDLLDKAIEYQNQYNQMMIESGNVLRKANSIRLNSELDLRKAFDQNLSLGDLNSVFESEILDLTKGLILGGSTDPQEIVRNIQGAASEKEKLRVARIEKQTEIAMPGNSQDEVKQLRNEEFKLIEKERDLAKAIDQSEEALQRLANDGSMAANALSKITEQRGRDVATGNFLEKLLTGSSADVDQMAYRNATLKAAQADPTILSKREARQNAFAGLQDLQGILTPEEFNKSKADLLRSSLQAQNINLKDSAISGGRSYEEILNSIEGGKVNEQDPAVIAYRDAIKAQEDAGKLIADKLSAAAKELELNTKAFELGVADPNLGINQFMTRFADDYPKIVSDAYDQVKKDLQTILDRAKENEGRNPVEEDKEEDRPRSAPPDTSGLDRYRGGTGRVADYVGLGDSVSGTGAAITDAVVAGGTLAAATAVGVKRVKGAPQRALVAAQRTDAVTAKIQEIMKRDGIGENEAKIKAEKEVPKTQKPTAKTSAQTKADADPTKTPRRSPTDKGVKPAGPPRRGDPGSPKPVTTSGVPKPTVAAPKSKFSFKGKGKAAAVVAGTIAAGVGIYALLNQREKAKKQQEAVASKEKALLEEAETLGIDTKDEKVQQDIRKLAGKTFGAETEEQADSTAQTGLKALQLESQGVDRQTAQRTAVKLSQASSDAEAEAILSSVDPSIQSPVEEMQKAQTLALSESMMNIASAVINVDSAMINGELSTGAGLSSEVSPLQLASLQASQPQPSVEVQSTEELDLFGGADPIEALNEEIQSYNKEIQTAAVESGIGLGTVTASSVGAGKIMQNAGPNSFRGKSFGGGGGGMIRAGGGMALGLVDVGLDAFGLKDDYIGERGSVSREAYETGMKGTQAGLIASSGPAGIAFNTAYDAVATGIEFARDPNATVNRWDSDTSASDNIANAVAALESIGFTGHLAAGVGLVSGSVQNAAGGFVRPVDTIAKGATQTVGLASDITSMINSAIKTSRMEGSARESMSSSLEDRGSSVGQDVSALSSLAKSEGTTELARAKSLGDMDASIMLLEDLVNKGFNLEQISQISNKTDVGGYLGGNIDLERLSSEGITDTSGLIDKMKAQRTSEADNQSRLRSQENSGFFGQKPDLDLASKASEQSKNLVFAEAQQELQRLGLSNKEKPTDSIDQPSTSGSDTLSSLAIADPKLFQAAGTIIGEAFLVAIKSFITQLMPVEQKEQHVAAEANVNPEVVVEPSESLGVLEKMANEATSPGSIYVHDTHIEALLEKMLNVSESQKPSEVDNGHNLKILDHISTMARKENESGNRSDMAIFANQLHTLAPEQYGPQGAKPMTVGELAGMPEDAYLEFLDNLDDYISAPSMPVDRLQERIGVIKDTKSENTNADGPKVYSTEATARASEKPQVRSSNTTTKSEPKDETLEKDRKAFEEERKAQEDKVSDAKNTRYDAQRKAGDANIAYDEAQQYTDEEQDRGLHFGYIEKVGETPEQAKAERDRLQKQRDARITEVEQKKQEADRKLAEAQTNENSAVESQQSFTQDNTGREESLKQRQEAGIKRAQLEQDRELVATGEFSGMDRFGASIAMYGMASSYRDEKEDIALKEKVSKGEKLTPEEQAKHDNYRSKEKNYYDNRRAKARANVEASQSQTTPVTFSAQQTTALGEAAEGANRLHDMRPGNTATTESQEDTAKTESQARAAEEPTQAMSNKPMTARQSMLAQRRQNHLQNKESRRQAYLSTLSPERRAKIEEKEEKANQSKQDRQLVKTQQSELNKAKIAKRLEEKQNSGGKLTKSQQQLVDNYKSQEAKKEMEARKKEENSIKSAGEAENNVADIGTDRLDFAIGGGDISQAAETQERANIARVEREQSEQAYTTNTPAQTVMLNNATPVTQQAIVSTETGQQPQQTGPDGSLAYTLTIDDKSTQVLQSFNDGLEKFANSFGDYVSRLENLEFTHKLEGEYNININFTGEAPLKALNETMKQLATDLVMPEIEKLREEVKNAGMDLRTRGTPG